jgi:hypothetical protein
MKRCSEWRAQSCWRASPISSPAPTSWIVRSSLRPNRYPIERPSGSCMQSSKRRRPRIFGALLDRLVIGIRQLPDTHLANPPRMAALQPGPWPAGSTDSRGHTRPIVRPRSTSTLEHDVLARAVRALVKSEWVGTATELLDLLGPTIKITNPKVLSDELARLAPMLRTVGLDIKYQRTADRRGIRIVRQ